MPHGRKDTVHSEAPTPVSKDARLLIPAPENPRHAHLGWPKIVRAGDGTLVAAYVAAEVHTRQGCPAVSLSMDDGQSFSAPHILQEFGEGEPFYHCGNVALGTADDGALVLLAMAMDKNRQQNTIVGWRSTDAGRTWEEADTSTLAGRVGSVYGHVFAIPNRGLAVGGHFREGPGLAQEGLWLALSEDHGRSWGEPAIVTRSRWFEPAFWHTDGRIVCIARDNSVEQYPQLVSDDLGETWREEPSKIGNRKGMPSPFLISRREQPTELFALQTLRRRDAGVYLWSADVHALQWRKGRTLVRFPEEGDYGYPWMTQIDDRHWMLLFYCGVVEGPNSIWGMKIQLT